MKLAAADQIVGAALLSEDRGSALVLENARGTELTVTRRYAVVGRGGKGFELAKRDRIVKVIPPELVLRELT
jgi:hypothetical protein